MPRPLHDSVWLIFPSGGRTVGGVYRAPGEPDAWMDAVVVAAGPEVPASLGVGVGDVVVANVFDGMPVDVDGVRYRSVPAGKLLAVVELSGPAPAPSRRKEVDMATKSCKKCVPVKHVKKGSVKRQRIDSTGKKGK